MAHINQKPNHPASANAALAVVLTIGHPGRGVPEPAR
jgi:hypothetical protein